MTALHNADLWLSLKHKVCALDTGETFPITTFQNINREPAQAGEAVAFVVAGPDKDGQWWSINLSMTKKVVLN